jgi:hypothetical protein|nr:MAG TPA_asm: Phi29 scaffolding protein [Caudoviricetes sp.]
MKDEEFDSLLSEIAKDETTLERKVEIVDTLKNDRKESNDKYQELVSNTAKLQEDYKSLQAKKVDEFFKQGTKPENPSDDLESDEGKPQEKLPTYEEIVHDMLGGKN